MGNENSCGPPAPTPSKARQLPPSTSHVLGSYWVIDKGGELDSRVNAFNSPLAVLGSHLRLGKGECDRLTPFSPCILAREQGQGKLP